MSSKTKTTATTEEARPTLVPKLRFPEFRGAEGWAPSALGEKSSILKGKGISKADLDPDGSQACIRYGELYTRYGETIREAVSRTKVPASELFLSKPDDVIIPSSGETKIDIAKASCVLAGGIALGGDLNVIRSKLNGTFLSYYLNGPKRLDIAKVAQGDTVVHLYPHQLEALRIAVPLPAEQQKIAECLSSVDDLIAAQARKVDALKTHKKGLMQQLFPTEGETQPRLRFPEFQNAGEWSEKPFGELLDGIIDFRGRTPVKLGMEWGGGNITSLSANNVKNGFIDYAAECNWGSEELYKRWMGDVNLEKEDIVFTMEAPLGKALLLPDSQKYILSQRVVAFKTKPVVRNPFLIQLIWSEGFQRAIDELATGSTAKGINQKALKTVLVKLPGPAEQQRIASCLSSLDTLITAETQKLEALKTHKKGLMQQLFPSPEGVEA